VCGLERERGERDFFLGAMMFNLIGVEMVFALVLTVWILLTLPNPPWVAIVVVGVILMLAAPVIFYPFSKMLWLAVDLIFRPERDDTLGGDRPIRPPPPTV
jgi:Na+/phosphate symporter